MKDIGFNMNLSNFALIIAVLLISVIALNVFVSFPLISATTSSSISSSSSQTESSLLWTTGANMPTKRSEVVGVALGEKIYVIAGLLTGHSDSPTNIVEVYDTKTDKWSTAAPLPEPLHHIAAAAYNGKVYVVGGWDAEKKSSNKLFIYDPDANRWQEGKPMPTARGGLTANLSMEFYMQ
jgi:N-acetylneuraminic acid mutarotase